MNRILAGTWLLATALYLSACSITGHRETPGKAATPPAATPTPPPAPMAGVPPPPNDPFAIPDAVPKFEPRARSGNPPFYEVFGKRYYVMASSLGYIERGVASWYGPGFHAERTSVGEPYDMYGMTAAHKTLSLPTYVRVTNLQNNRSIVVRVNDRGPFVGNRIIDLSYTAAAKLDMLRKGTAFVEVRAIDPTANPITAVTPITSALLTAPPASTAATPTPPTPTPSSEPAPTPPVTAANSPAPAPTATSVPTSAARNGLFVQAGAFTDRTNAERLASRLRLGPYGTVFVRESQSSGRTFYRVRIGPIADVPAFDRTVKALESAGVSDVHLALD
jgi:rare lipoprotein A